MEVHIESERYNPMLKRREVNFRIRFNGKTPTRNEVREKIAGLLTSEIDRVVVDYIKTEFGKREAKCYAKIYDTAEELKNIEEEHILIRNFPELKKMKELKEEVSK
ncbi:MAG: 30S ribosomal protein S24e [Archaeoglobaceae archaeon]|nr:30S ribosomal protein S24e [Archaeoglobaceae archaeon]MDW7989163.1 30S ribosomal protein S24e [Archaeoglobaceae archaeon]